MSDTQLTPAMLPSKDALEEADDPESFMRGWMAAWEQFSDLLAAADGLVRFIDASGQRWDLGGWPKVLREAVARAKGQEGK